MLPLAASKGQKVGGVPLGDVESGTWSEFVSHPNTKLQREWQWARMTTACTSSASDQHCSPSSVWNQQGEDERRCASGCQESTTAGWCGCFTWMCEQAVSQG